MKITFIGLGVMGSAIVERLLQQNFEITVFNRTPEKANALVDLGAKRANSLQEAVSDADLIMTSLLDDQAVLDVATSMINHLKPDAIHMGLSTILPETAERLLAMHQESGTYYLSGTVLGVPLVAREGNLTTYYAGSPAVTGAVKPVLAAFSVHIHLLGDEATIKSPNLMKICMNYSLMTTLELMSELYAFAEKTGLDKEQIKRSLHEIYGHSAFTRYIDKIADRDFDAINFTMTGGYKDARIFKAAFTTAGIPTELCNLLNQRYQEALAMGMKDKDWSGIYEVVRKKSDLSDPSSSIK